MVQKTIERHCMVASGDLVVVAVSGGPDSMCLLDVLCTLSPDLGLKLHVAHLNHHMREQAPRDARMVSSFAEGLGVRCTIGDADVNDLARRRGIGVEEAGREARYSFLRGLRREIGAQRIALGHNRNDQAETVLMRLLRGAGTQGLAGIPPVNGHLIRPIIGVSRRLTEEYCAARGLPTILDVYNLDPQYTRNALRLEVIPDLERRFNPSLINSLSETATALRWDAQFLDAMAEEAFHAASRLQARVTSLDLGTLRSMPPALSSRVLELAWRECSRSQGNLPLRHIQELLWSSRNIVTLPHGVTAERDGDVEVGFYPEPPSGLETGLPAEGSVDVPELGVSFHTRMISGAGEDLLQRAVQGASGNVPDGYPSWIVEPVMGLDFHRLKGPLIVRTRRRGDRFRPLGMGGREQKLQDFFVQRKVPRFYRDFTPIVASAGDIVCVAGLRLAEDFRVSSHTTCMLEVEVRPYLRCSSNYATLWRSPPTFGRVYS